MKKNKGFACFLRVVFLLIVWNSDHVFAIDISDSPLEAQLGNIPANVMLIIDNSKSMDSEFVTSESGGFFKEYYYLFPDRSYSSKPDHEYGSGYSLSAIQRKAWISQWHGYNRIYYNPKVTYLPWISTQRYLFHHADLNQPFSDPMKNRTGSARFLMNDEFLKIYCGQEMVTITNAHYFTIIDNNANGRYDEGEAVYLVTWVDNDGNSKLDWTDQIQMDRRRYYRFVDNGNGLIEDNELRLITDDTEMNLIKPAYYNEKGDFLRFKTDREDLQNFVNWFSYYRRRVLSVKAALSQSINKIKKINLGVFATAGNARFEPKSIGLDSVRPMTVSSQTSTRTANIDEDHLDSDMTEYVLNAIYRMESKDELSPKAAMDRVGRYYHQELSSDLGRSPYEDENQGVGCRAVYTIVISDGYNHNDYEGVGNADGNKGKPFADAFANTLADLAMHYYETDLAPEWPDILPPKDCDRAKHQHMVTYTVAFGQEGSIKSDGAAFEQHNGNISNDNDPCFMSQNMPMHSWPDPIPDTSATIDDLWHAAVNGRGLYFQTHTAETIQSAIKEIIAHINQPLISEDDAIHSTMAVYDDVQYKTKYRPGEWNGELSACSFNPESGSAINSQGNILWNASEQLMNAGVSFESRRIISYGGFWRYPQGIPFRYDTLSDSQRRVLGSDLIKGSSADEDARKLINYIRGKEEKQFRKRTGILGDIVHSVPVVSGGTVFVGANDGMLHAFNNANGVERFAYIPNMVLGNLKALSEDNYAGHHQFYVDGTPYAGEVMVGIFRRNTYLVGGLGKGGRGCYCLFIRSRYRPQNGSQYNEYQETLSIDHSDSVSNEHDLSRLVKWEYPRPDTDNDDMDNDGDGLTDEPDEVDADLGFGYSQAYVVNANAPENKFRPVVVFGNGYNSVTGKAVLYILDADKGTIIRKIDTGVSGDNGLSTPALIDVNLDRCMDYAFAGDLRGNLWKFDLTSDNPSRWGVAYGQDLSGNGVIDSNDGDVPVPLFQAKNQPITCRPNIMRMHSQCSPQVPGFMVIFGTGRFLGQLDRSDSNQQTIYGIWDYGDDDDDSEAVGCLIDRSSGQLSSGLTLVRQQVISQIVEQGVIRRFLSETQPDYATMDDIEDGDGLTSNNRQKKQSDNPIHDVGWFFDFPDENNNETYPAERVISEISIRDGKVVIVSIAPSNDPCGGNGVSWIYILGGCDGNTIDDQEDQPLLPWRNETTIINPIYILKPQKRSTLEKLFIGDLHGRLIEQEFVGENWGKVYWWQNLRE